MIDLNAYMMGRDKEFPPTPDMVVGANNLLNRVEALMYELGIELSNDDVSSGYRPGRYNTAAGGSPNSAHLKCVAVDLGPRVRKAFLAHFPEWKKAGSEDRKKLEAILEKHGLYLEHPDNTLTWIHLQTRTTRNRIFIPY